MQLTYYQHHSRALARAAVAGDADVMELAVEAARKRSEAALARVSEEQARAATAIAAATAQRRERGASADAPASGGAPPVLSTGEYVALRAEQALQAAAIERDAIRRGLWAPVPPA